MLRIVARADLRLPVARLAKPGVGSALASAMAHGIFSPPSRKMDWEENNDNEDDKEPAKRNGRRDVSLISRNFREIWGWGREIKKRNLGEKKRNSGPGQMGLTKSI